MLDARLNGALLDYFRMVSRPSGKATHPDWTVGRKKRVTADLPTGSHLLELRLLAPEGATCLVRVRQIESSGEE